jgi:NTP pyrophosphatase (non-canonical NTP hydrolase)
MTINDYCKQCSEIAVSKGFDLKQMPEQLLLIASEVGEALENLEIDYDQNDRLRIKTNTHVMDFVVSMAIFENRREGNFYEELIREPFKLKQPNNLPEELADIAIRLFSFCGGNGIDLQKAIDDKIEKNMAREYLHGKRF